MTNGNPTDEPVPPSPDSRPKSAYSDAGRIELLGQVIHFPSATSAVISFSVFLISVVFACVLIVYILVVPAKRDNIEALKNWWSGTVYADGKSNPERSQQMSFFTPNSTKCADKSTNEEESKKEKEFGVELKKQGQGSIIAYRRYKAYDDGEHGPREGWWWIVTAKKDYDESNIARVYKEKWCEEGIYMELRNSERHLAKQ